MMAFDDSKPPTCSPSLLQATTRQISYLHVGEGFFYHIDNVVMDSAAIHTVDNCHCLEDLLPHISHLGSLCNTAMVRVSMDHKMVTTTIHGKYTF
jgi:hypothetical protein